MRADDEPLPLRAELLRADDEPLPLPLRDEPLRADDEPPRADDEPLPLRDELLRADELPLARDGLLRADEVPLPLRDRDVDRELRDVVERDAVERDAVERERAAVVRDRDREREAVAVRRSAAGISALATSFVRRGISFSRKLAMRSSSRLIAFASLAVSLSPTVSASDSIAV